jgi:hypothetical protein
MAEVSSGLHRPPRLHRAPRGVASGRSSAYQRDWSWVQPRGRTRRKPRVHRGSPLARRRKSHFYVGGPLRALQGSGDTTGKTPRGRRLPALPDRKRVK